MTRSQSVFILLVCAGFPVRADEVSDLRRQLAETESERDAAQDQVATLRSQLIENTLEVKERVKDKERQQALDIRKEKTELTEKHHNEQYLRNWAVANFDDTRHGRLPTTRVGEYIKRLQKAKLAATRVLLEFPQQSRLAITNGRALNTFLDLCGKAALNHQQYRREFDRLTELGHQIGGQRVLRREDIERVQFKKGPRESTLTVDAKRGALTLDWPALLLADSDCSEHLRSLEQAKTEAEAELREQRPVKAATQMQMLQAADEIKKLFDKEYKRFHEEWKTGGHDAVVASQYLAAQQFVQGMRSDIAQFITARSLADIRCDELFEGAEALFSGGPQNEPVAVEELMAFMVKRGYRFGAAKTGGEQVYQMLYNQMVDYYLDLHRIQVALEEADREYSQEVSRLDRETDELMKSSTWDPTADTIKMLTAKPPEGFLDYALLLGQSVADYGRAQDQPSQPAEPPLTPKWTEFEPGDRVSNKGFRIWWRGRVVELVGDRYRIEMFYVDPAFQSRWQVTGIYEFAEGQIKRL